MLDLLNEALEELPDLIGRDGPEWNSLNIDYHCPIVKRIWINWREDYRINVHMIMPCSPEEALWHPHSWPSAMLVLGGKYEMGIGQEIIKDKPWTSRIRRPSPVAKILMVPGSTYEMEDQGGWHYVAPIGPEPVFTVMLTGQPFERRLTEPERKLLKLPKPEFRLTSLSDREIEDIQTIGYLLLQKWQLSSD